MDRRQFLAMSAVAAAAGSAGLDLVLRRRTLDKVGVQLFSLPRVMEKDFRAGIAMLAGMGYTEVELYGPFPFSAPEAIAGWNAVTPQLGFSGSGFFGLTPQQVRATLDQHGMTAPSVHTDWATLQTGMGRLADAAQVVGYTYVGLPSIPDALRANLDGYKRMADAFNKVGAEAKRLGLKFAYHNHGYGLVPMEGQVPLELLLKNTDPSLVFFEMDIYWTVSGGADPVALLKANPGRYHLMHVKDMKEKKRFSGDGGNSNQWIEMFPYMTTAGDGVMALPAIISAARDSGMTHFFVEQDLVANPEVALKRSLDYVRKL
ncbi:MAG: sugar phosphate isomerase/epimerase [Gemmatimonadota bacterium]